MNKDTQILLLEYFKAIAIGLGILFAILELRNFSEEQNINRFENTSRMISGLGRQDVIRGASALLNAVVTEEPKMPWEELVVELTPYRQHLITWSACIEFNNCEQDGSIRYFCRILLTYEGGMKLLHQKYDKTYNEEWRMQSYFGQHGKCGLQFPSLAATINDSVLVTQTGQP